jgi:hypothetical protein
MNPNPNDEPGDAKRSNRLNRSTNSEEPKERLEAFYLMLRTRKYAVPIPNPPTPQWTRLVTLLDAPSNKWSWNQAYEAEEILIWLIADGTLATAFSAMAADAADNISKEAIERRQKDFAAAPDALSKRMALQALAEDLHEHWATEDERLEYFRQITESTAGFLQYFLYAFISSLIVLLINGHFHPGTSLHPSLMNLPLFLVVLTSGLFGAGMSMLIGLNARLEAASMPALEKMALTVNRWARSVVGAGAAAVLFAMCIGGLLEGKAMPALRVGEKLKDQIDATTLGHLVVLCILAGFSEKFIPSKLNDLEK